MHSVVAPLLSDLEDELPALAREFRPLSQAADLESESATAAIHPTTSTTRTDSEKLAKDGDKQDVVYYLAYGSNLSAETFLGRRAIKPLSQMNVCVPTLRLTFDLPGLPYMEPCFANTAMRDPSASTTSKKENGKAPDYHKNRWHKPLVGVLYGLTPKDFIHVIATEGGGSSYQDITVQCFPLQSGSSTVPSEPSGEHIAAHTLFAPYIPPPKHGQPGPGANVCFGRPDPSFAQPSARYLKLIKDGALEHDLPAEYREYLAGIRPYVVRTQGQRMGQFVFGTLWLPIVMFMFGIARLVAGKDGRVPKWFASIQALIFSSMWRTYDGFFKRIFGDGERSVGKVEHAV